MRHIVPFIHTVDYVFNGALPYELPYYRDRLLPYFDGMLKTFSKDPKKLDATIRAQRVKELLESFTAAPDDSLVPKTSLLREFIGGSDYRY